MLDTFNALASETSDNGNTLADEAQENSQVDFSAIINRINDLENKFNEIAQMLQTVPKTEYQNSAETNGGENIPSEEKNAESEENENAS